MRETEAGLRSTQLLSMNLLMNTPAPVALSPLLVCFVESKLSSDGSNLVKDIICLNPDFPAWHGIKTLHKSLLTENEKLINCKETMQMLAARLS